MRVRVFFWDKIWLSSISWLAGNSIFPLCLLSAGVKTICAPAITSLLTTGLVLRLM